MKWWVVKRAVHVSWIMALCAFAILIGVTVAQQDALAIFTSPSWLLVAGGLLAIALWKQYGYILPLVVISGLLIGLWRGSVEHQALTPYKHLIGYTATLEGIVSEDTDKGKAGETTMHLTQLIINGHPLGGSVWASVTTNTIIERSDHIIIKGRLTPGFGTFSASLYQAQLIVLNRPQPGDVALRLRDWFSRAVEKAIPQPEAGLGLGYLVGQRTSLPAELDNALRTAGLTHVVVASGYNLTILVRLARRLFVKVSKYLSFLAASGMIVSFIAITGASPSMSRAGLVAGLSLLAWYYGRTFHPLVLLPLTAAVTVLIQPRYAWGDVGWQLSFAAFFGVMTIAPLIQAYFFGNQKPGTVRQIVGETIAAQALTLPIILLNFGQLSNVAVIANLLILPFVPLAMLLTFGAGVLALLVPAFATPGGLPAFWLLHYMTSLTEYIAHLPGAATQLSITPEGMVLCYVGIAVIGGYAWYKTRLNLRSSNLVE